MSYLIDFRDVSLQTCIERNNSRVGFQEYKYVPIDVINKMHKKLMSMRVPKGYEVIKPEDFEHITLESTKVDLSKYDNIYHVGDIQGMGGAITEFLEVYPIMDNNFYIFTGDWIDRGDSNHIALEVFIKLSKLPNVIVIEGNHDRYLMNYLNGIEVVYPEFVDKTLPQILSSSLDLKELKKAVEVFKPFFYYWYNNKDIFTNHGGLSCLPQYVTLLSRNDYVRGSGLYNEIDIVDNAFVVNIKDNQYQIHGHRNTNQAPVQSTERTFNLEGNVEYGGRLIVVVLNKEGFEAFKFPDS